MESNYLTDEVSEEKQSRNAYNESMVSSAHSLAKDNATMALGSTLCTHPSVENLMEAGDNNLIISIEGKTYGDACKLQNAEQQSFCDKKPLTDSKMAQINSERLMLLKLNEKWLFKGEISTSLMNNIIEFVMQDVSDVETIRRAMYCQVQRYHLRHQGYEMLSVILQTSGLFDSVKYNMINGFLGLFYEECNKSTTANIMENLSCITAFQKVNLMLAQSQILKWAIIELQKLVNEERIPTKNLKHKSCYKDNTNMGTYVFLKKLPRMRFLLGMLGILAKDIGPNEINLLINSGILGTVLGLLGQTGGCVQNIKTNTELSIVYEDTIIKNNSNKVVLAGPELAKLMKIGTRVVRGANWKWSDQDGNPPGEGRIISEVGEDG